MKIITFTLIINLIFFEIFGSKVRVTKFENCEKNNYDIKAVATFTEKGGNQYADFSLKNKVPIGDNLMAYFLIYTSVDQKNYRKIFALHEKVCTGIKNYIGEFAYDLERSFGLVPGACPIPPGNYSINHYLLDFKKFKLKTFPVGYVKFIGYMNDAATNKTRTCLHVAVTLSIGK